MSDELKRQILVLMQSGTPQSHELRLLADAGAFSAQLGMVCSPLARLLSQGYTSEDALRMNYRNLLDRLPDLLCSLMLLGALTGWIRPEEVVDQMERMLPFVIKTRIRENTERSKGHGKI